MFTRWCFRYSRKPEDAPVTQLKFNKGLELNEDECYLSILDRVEQYDTFGSQNDLDHKAYLEIIGALVNLVEVKR